MADQTSEMYTPVQHATAAGKGFWNSAKGRVARKPGTFLVAMLLVLVLLIVFMTWTWNLRRKEGFSGSPYQVPGFDRTSNWQSGGNNSQWQLGGMHAGAGGPVDTAWTDFHNIHRATPFNPALRGAVYGGQHHAGPAGNKKEGLTGTDPTSNPVYFQAASPNYSMTDPASMAYLSGAATSYSGACGGMWDPTATSEAQALSQIGSLEHDDFGESALQTAINAAYDVNPSPPVTGNGTTFNDAQLAAMAY